jgi:hypothetical protein
MQPSDLRNDLPYGSFGQATDRISEKPSMYNDNVERVKSDKTSSSHNRFRKPVYHILSCMFLLPFILIGIALVVNLIAAHKTKTQTKRRRRSNQRSNKESVVNMASSHSSNFPSLSSDIARTHNHEDTDRLPIHVRAKSSHPTSEKSNNVHSRGKISSTIKKSEGPSNPNCRMEGNVDDFMKEFDGFLKNQFPNDTSLRQKIRKEKKRTYATSPSERFRQEVQIPMSNLNQNGLVTKEGEGDCQQQSGTCSFLKNNTPPCKTADGKSPCPLVDPSDYSVVTNRSTKPSGGGDEAENTTGNGDDDPCPDTENKCNYKQWQDIPNTCKGPCNGKAKKRQKKVPQNPGNGCPVCYRSVPCVVANPCYCTDITSKLGNNVQKCSGSSCTDAKPGSTCRVGCTDAQMQLEGPDKYYCQRGEWVTNKNSMLAQDQDRPECSRKFKTCPNLTGSTRYHISASYFDPNTSEYKTSVCIQARNKDKCHIYCKSGYESQNGDPSKPGNNMLLTCTQDPNSGKMYWNPAPKDKCKCGDCGEQGEADVCCPTERFSTPPPQVHNNIIEYT